MKKIIINGNDNGKENYIARKKFYEGNGWTIKDEDDFGCIVERVNHKGYIVEIQLLIEGGHLYEINL